MGRVYIKLNTDEVNQELESRIMVANRLVLEDIYEKAMPFTPMDTSNLRHNVSRRVEGKDGIIEWKEPYASYQNRGMRADGSRVVKHYTTPGTGSHFADNAVSRVLSDIERYYDNLI